MCLSFSMNAETFQPGKDYAIISSIPHEKVTKCVTVKAFFSYGCPWCFRIEKPLQAFVKQHQSKIKFEKVPVVFSPTWYLYAKVFYYAVMEDIEAESSPKLFDAIINKHETLLSEEQMGHFFYRETGLVSESTATSKLKSLSILDKKVKDAMRQMAIYHINAVPAIVVNEQYKVDLKMAKNTDRFFEIVAFLINKTQNSSAP